MKDGNEFTVRVSLDGSDWAAVAGDCLATAPAGFGKTPGDALRALGETLGDGHPDDWATASVVRELVRAARSLESAMGTSPTYVDPEREVLKRATDDGASWLERFDVLPKLVDVRK